MSTTSSPNNRSIQTARLAMAVACAVVLLTLVIGSISNDEFWMTNDQRADRLMESGEFAAAAELYSDPKRIGFAQFRDGEFEDAAKAFSRVPGAEGAFNQGNAWLMNGKYDQAIASYDRALSLRLDWIAAGENRSIAVARKAVLGTAAEQRTDQGSKVGADEIVFDEKGENRKGEPQEMSEGGELSDSEMRALWLRQVKTTPGDFLRAKFAYQAAMQESRDTEEEE